MTRFRFLPGWANKWRFERWRKSPEASLALRAAAKLLAHAQESDYFMHVMGDKTRVLTDAETLAYARMVFLVAGLEDVA